MKKINHSRLALAFALSALALSGLAPTAASAACGEDGSGCWTFRGLAGTAQTDEEIYVARTFPEGGGEHFKYAVSDGTAWALGAEYLFNPKFGLDLGFGRANFDAMAAYDVFDIWEMDNDDLTASMFTVAPNFHLTPDRKVDLYLGPFLALTSFDTSTHRILGEDVNQEFDDDEFGVGAQVGIDIPFSDKWAFAALARYLPLSTNADGFVAGDLDLDPLELMAGLAFSPRFGSRGRSARSAPAAPAPAAPAPVAPAPAPVAAPAPATPVAPAAPESDMAAAPAAPEPRAVRTDSVNFTFADSRVSNIGKAKLDEIGLSMVQDLSLEAHIVGHADSRGSDAANMKRSESRAEAVKQYLVERYEIDPARITTEGVGASQPIASNDTAEGRAKNRRVEIVVSQ